VAFPSISKCLRVSFRSGVVMGVVTINETINVTKTNTTLLLAGAVALGFTLTTANGADIAASPRLQQQLNERKTLASTDASPNIVSSVYLGAAAKSEQSRPRFVPSTTAHNLVSGNYPGVAAKNPYFRPAPVEIAPLKEKSK